MGALTSRAQGGDLSDQAATGGGWEHSEESNGSRRIAA